MKKSLYIIMVALVCFACKADRTPSSPSSPSLVDTVAPRATSLTMAFMGDVMGGTTYPDGPYLPADEGRHIFDECRDIISRVDIAAANCEGVVGTGGKPKSCANPKVCFAFRQPPYMAQRFAEAGIDFMNLANNHSNDFGDTGIRETLKNLTAQNIAVAGLRREAPYAIVESNGLKVGFIGFGAGSKTPSINDMDDLATRIKELKKRCDIVVVSMHAGAEGSGYTHVPRRMEMFHGEKRGDVYKFAHTAIDAGADVVWGHGPHVPRGMEIYSDRLIMYSLGNFCTPFRMGLAGATGMAPLVEVKINADGTFAGGEIHSFIQQKGKGPRKDVSGSVAEFISTLTRQDFPDTPLKITSEGILER